MASRDNVRDELLAAAASVLDIQERSASSSRSSDDGKRKLQYRINVLEQEKRVLAFQLHAAQIENTELKELMNTQTPEVATALAERDEALRKLAEARSMIRDLLEERKEERMGSSTMLNTSTAIQSRSSSGGSSERSWIRLDPADPSSGLLSSDQSTVTPARLGRDGPRTQTSIIVRQDGVRSNNSSPSPAPSTPRRVRPSGESRIGDLRQEGSRHRARTIATVPCHLHPPSPPPDDRASPRHNSRTRDEPRQQELIQSEDQLLESTDNVVDSDWYLEYTNGPARAEFGVCRSDERIAELVNVEEEIIQGMANAKFPVMQICIQESKVFMYNPILLEGPESTYYVSWAQRRIWHRLLTLLQLDEGGSSSFHVFVHLPGQDHWWYVGMHTFSVVEVHQIWPTLDDEEKDQLINELRKRWKNAPSRRELVNMMKPGSKIEQFTLKLSHTGHRKQSVHFARDVLFESAPPPESDN